MAIKGVWRNYQAPFIVVIIFSDALEQYSMNSAEYRLSCNYFLLWKTTLSLWSGLSLYLVVCQS